MDIKEMPLEEKYDKLLDSYLVNAITSYALVNELNAADKGIEFSADVSAKLLPNRVGVAFELLKAIAPGIVFNQLVENYAYSV